MTNPLRELSITERIALVADLWDSIAFDLATLPVDDTQREELDLRLAAWRLRRCEDAPRLVVEPVARRP
ncbi:MAG TPA: addiction module protein [Pseudomonadales bacterium]|nr:addiction module protein [Pseudomonadales bacterium]